MLNVEQLLGDKSMELFDVNELDEDEEFEEF